MGLFDWAQNGRAAPEGAMVMEMVVACQGLFAGKAGSYRFTLPV